MQQEPNTKSFSEGLNALLGSLDGRTTLESDHEKEVEYVLDRFEVVQHIDYVRGRQQIVIREDMSKRDEGE